MGRWNHDLDCEPTQLTSQREHLVARCIIDGEAVASTATDCRCSTGCDTDARTDKWFLYAFDLLELNGQDMRREPLEVRKRALATVLLRKADVGIQFNEHCDDLPADVLFRHACKMGLEGIVSKRLGSPYRSGRSRDWLKMKNPNAPAVKREAEEDWGRRTWRL